MKIRSIFFFLDESNLIVDSFLSIYNLLSDYQVTKNVDYSINVNQMLTGYTCVSLHDTSIISNMIPTLLEESNIPNQTKPHIFTVIQTPLPRPHLGQEMKSVVPPFVKKFEPQGLKARIRTVGARGSNPNRRGQSLESEPQGLASRIRTVGA